MLYPVVVVLVLAVPHSFTGTVVALHDGDTVTVLDGKTQVKVRLNAIDAPERKQAFGTKSKDALAVRIFGKTVTVLWNEHDRYGRTLGHVMLDGQWINKWMVQEGWAWHYKQYSHDKRLARWEDESRAAKKGLWSDPHPEAPWVFRHKAKPAKKRAA